jgi:hypothetical protein
MKRIAELKFRMVNVRNDLWYEIKDFRLDLEGFIVEVLGDNGTWYKVNETKGLI